MGLLDEYVKRYGEPALGLLSSAAAEPVAGWAGLLSGGDAGAVERTRNALTYQPKSAAGKAGQNAMANALLGLKTTMVDNNPPVRAAVDGYNALADLMGAKHPALGAAVRTAPAALGLLAGPGSSATRSAVANVAKGTGKTAMRELGPTAGVMAENYMRRTGGLLDIFAGDGSKTANRGLLDQAKAMQAQGVPDDQIYAKTGWFNGMPDKKWRYEIPDNKAYYDPEALQDLRMMAKDEGRQFDPLKDTSFVGGVLGHKPLFDAYPNLENAPVHFMPGNRTKGAQGAYSRKHDRLTLNDALSNGDAKSYSLHELQHAVQQREGFAGGGNFEDVMPMLDDYANAKAQFDRALQESMTATDPIAKANAQQARQFYGLKLGKMAQLRDLKPQEAYQRLAGEAEARLVQSRMNMTPAERAASYPPSMFDVPIDQQIVRFK